MLGNFETVCLLNSKFKETTEETSILSSHCLYRHYTTGEIDNLLKFALLFVFMVTSPLLDLSLTCIHRQGTHIFCGFYSHYRILLHQGRKPKTEGRSTRQES